jgi:hypothetical protein
MNYLPFVSYGFYGAASDAEMYTRFCSYGLLGSAPAPSVKTYFRVPTIPVIPIIPTMGNFFMLLYILFT